MSDLTCPFCKQEDFDHIGLKDHLQYHCEPFDLTISIREERMRRMIEKVPEKVVEL